MIRNLRAAFKLTILLTATLIALPWALLTHSLAKNRLRCGRWWTQHWCGFAWRVLGGHVEVLGGPPPTGGGMIVSNHMSYLDIMLHGSLFGMRFFAQGGDEEVADRRSDDRAHQSGVDLPPPPQPFRGRHA